MYLKAILMEIKEDYCLALTDDGFIIRIKKRRGVSVGGKIYVLEEDLYKDVSNDNISSVSNRKIVKSDLLKRASLVAAAILTFITAGLFNLSQREVYAVVSIDSDSSVQMELNKNNKIKSVTSLNGSVNQTLLRSFVGKDFSSSKEELINLASSNKAPAVIAYATTKEDKDYSDSLKRQLEDFADKGDKDDIIHLKGTSEDFKSSIKSKQSLGIRILSKIAEENRFEDILEGNSAMEISLEELLDLLRRIPSLQYEKQLIEIIENKIAELNKLNDEIHKEDSNELDDDTDNNAEDSATDDSIPASDGYVIPEPSQSNEWYSPGGSNSTYNYYDDDYDDFDDDDDYDDYDDD